MSQQTCIMCKQAQCIFAVVSEIAYTYNIGTSFGNRHFCLCIWDTRHYQTVKAMGINPRTWLIIMPKFKKFLPVVMGIWVQTDGHIDIQDQLLDSPLVIGPVVNNKLIGSSSHIYANIRYKCNVYDVNFNWGRRSVTFILILEYYFNTTCHILNGEEV